METREFKGEITTAYGKKLAKALPFTGTYEAYTKDAAGIVLCRQDGKWPNELDVLEGLVNDSEKMRKRAEAIEAKLKENGILKPQADSPEVVLTSTFKNLMLAKKKDGSAKYTESEARAVAADMTGYDWPTE